MPAIASSTGAQSSMFPHAQALSMGSPKPQAAYDTRAESPASTTSESSTKSTASILSQQPLTASALFLGNNNPKLQNMPAIANSASVQSSMFPRAQALSMGSPKPASEARAESPASTTSVSSSKSTASILSQQSMKASALFVGNKFI
ncbi:hypothetical protein BJ741DRAFT_661833 [Chytriomyces cf. hyalinus JEL632]|nr:hypothetical protein BJ741DRAFT_661833 [Chytriomyces cf. hyalinus JEL632]